MIGLTDLVNEETGISDDETKELIGLAHDQAMEAAEIVEDLEAQGLLEKIEPHSHKVGTCSRCDTVVEPRLSDQWFVRMAPLAEPALGESVGDLVDRPATARRSLRDRRRDGGDEAGPLRARAAGGDATRRGGSRRGR